MVAAPSRQRVLWFADQVLPHEPALRAWLSRHLHGWSKIRLDVDDVVQESYAILAKLDDVGHIRNPRAYLFKSAQSVILQHVRRSRIVSIEAVAEIDQLEVPHDQRSPERYAAARQELHHIGLLIASLPTKCREVFTLRKVHGLSQREIAMRMHISESTVEKHIGKGLRLLADAMAQPEGAGTPAGDSIGKLGKQRDGHDQAK